MKSGDVQVEEFDDQWIIINGGISICQSIQEASGCSSGLSVDG